MGLKVLNLKEFLLSHIFLVGGLILLTFGLLWGGMEGIIVLTITGIWGFALGLCLTFYFAFNKLVAK